MTSAGGSLGTGALFYSYCIPLSSLNQGSRRCHSVLNLTSTRQPLIDSPGCLVPYLPHPLPVFHPLFRLTLSLSTLRPYHYVAPRPPTPLCHFTGITHWRRHHFRDRRRSGVFAFLPRNPLLSFPPSPLQLQPPPPQLREQRGRWDTSGEEMEANQRGSACCVS